MYPRLLSCLSWMVLGALASAQPTSNLSVEWIQSGAPYAFAALPDVHWTGDGSLLMDVAGGAGWETLDPVSGQSSLTLDRKAAMRSLGEALGRAPRYLPWPTGFDAAGRRGLYTLLGDVFVLDVAASQFHRVTKTPGAEKAARLSPDGRQVAFVRDTDLWVHDLESQKTRRLTYDGTKTLLNGTLPWVYWEEIFGRQDTGYWWSPDSRAIAFLQSDESKVTEVVHLDFKPQVPRVIRQRYPKAGTTNPSVRLGLLDLASGDIVWAKLGAPAPEYIVRTKWLPDGDRISVQTLNRDQNELDLWIVDRKTGEGKKVLTEKDAGWINIHDDLYFLEDKKHFLWVSERDGWSHLYRYSLDGKLVNQVTKGPWTLKASSAVFWMRQAVQAIDEKQGVVYFCALKDSLLQTRMYRVKLDGSELTPVTKEEGTHSIRFAPHAKHYLDEVSRIDRAPSLTLHTADGKTIKTLQADRTAAVEKTGIVWPELTSIPARDGFPLPAWIYRPKNFDPKKRHPVILYTYGGPASRSVTDSWQHTDLFWNNLLTSRGFVVACVDNRTATGISKKVENEIRGRMTSDSELRDVVDGVKWFKEQPWVDGDRIGIWGWSNGGMMTLLAMTRSQEFKAGIAVAPVTKWEYYDTIWCEQVNKRPQTNPEGFAHTDLTARAKDLHGRLLLVHGTYDDNVHIQNTWHFVDELVKANKMFDLMVYPMRKHGISDRPARIHLYNRMLEFWTRNL